MGILAKTTSFARRLSVFYLFIAIFSVFFGVFFYKFIPNNQAELNSRGFRILDQLSENVIQKDANLAVALTNVNNAKASDSERQVLNRQIEEHIPFNLEGESDIQAMARAEVRGMGRNLGRGRASGNVTVVGTTGTLTAGRTAGNAGKSGATAENVSDSGRFRFSKDLGWRMVYPLGGQQKALVKIDNFIRPVLATRDDLFDNYLLLERDPSGKDGDHLMKILYMQSAITSSSGISADSALNLQKNTDLSDVSEVVIGGQTFTMFFQPFVLQGARVVLAGLISKPVYDEKTKTLPVNFVVAMILVIILGFIILPFVKVFFLSPKENVFKRDILGIMLSVYLGSALLVLSGCYFLADYTANKKVSNQLNNLSDTLEEEIHSDLRRAGQQMEQYAAIYDTMRYKEVLCYKDTMLAHRYAVDHAMVPTIYQHVFRMFWIDDKGATLAKWNPFRFNAPLSSVQDYRYFKLLQDKSRDDTSLVLYAGKSNITSEFQLFLARRKRMPVVYDVAGGAMTAGMRGGLAVAGGTARGGRTGAGRTGAGGMEADKTGAVRMGAVRTRGGRSMVGRAGEGNGMTGETRGGRPQTKESYAMVLAFYLNSGLRAVLPEGYGFCLVDNQSMDVLMHSDNRRNLSENIYLETNRNQRLKNCIDFRNESLITGTELYGSPTMLYVKPLRGQQLSLVVYYNTHTFAENIFRMVHFAAETILYITIAISICILLSTSIGAKPSKLSFNIDPVEWVRPLRRNKKSYQFTLYFFSLLLGLGILYFGVLFLGRLDIRVAYYISLVLPFYAVWGFLASRKKEKPLFPPESQMVKSMLGSTSWTDTFRTGGGYWFLELFTASKAIVLVLVLINWFIFRLVTKQGMDHSGEVLPLFVLFQLLALAAMGGCYYFVFIKKRADEKLSGGFTASYLYSLYLSMLVISVLPSLGFVWYGWTVEKVQYTRSDDLYIADKNVARMKYLTRELLPDMKRRVRDTLDARYDYTKQLVNKSCQYLDGQTIESPFDIDARGCCSTTSALHDPDNPYITLLDELFLVTSGEYDSYSIQKHAADSSWRFLACAPDSVNLYRVVKVDSANGVGEASDPLIGDFRVRSNLRSALFSLRDIGLFHGSILLMLIAAFLFTAPWLLALTVNRMFLLDFITKGSVKVGPGNIVSKLFGGRQAPAAGFLLDRNNFPVPRDEQEEYILRTMMANKTDYQALWEGLPREEQYFLYDFARDGYINYKDAETLFSLVEKGVLLYNHSELRLFSISFREFLLRKKGTAEVASLKEDYSVPGVWATIRIPALIVIAACAVLLLITQESVSHKITVLITSVGAIVPVLLELTKKISGKT